jgi:hypothetical protein
MRVTTIIISTRVKPAERSGVLILISIILSI